MLKIPRLKQTKIVAVAALVYITVYFATFPSFFASIDEHEYLRNALLLQKGTLTESDATQACTGKFNGEGYVNQYFIGRSFFLIPFTWLGFAAAMASGLVIHLINFVLFYKIIRKLGYNQLYCLLYLFYPAFLWESRTLNSELLALTGILGGTLFYLYETRKWNFISGLIFGLAPLVRQETILISGVFFIRPLLKDRKKLTLMAIGFMAGISVLLLTNRMFYGGAFSSGYGNPLSFVADIGTNPLFIQNLAKFALILSLSLPLLIISPLFSERRIRYEVMLATVVFIVFYAQNSGIAVLPFLHATVFTGQLRYIIPVIGLMLLAYPALSERLCALFRLKSRIILPALVLLLAALSVSASLIHADFLDDKRAVYSAIYSNTQNGSLLIGSSDDCNYVLNGIFEKRYYLDAKGVKVNELRNKYSSIYVLDISYSTVDPSSVRGKIVSRERQSLKDFISENKENMSLIYKTEKPHYLAIYRYNGV